MIGRDSDADVLERGIEEARGRVDQTLDALRARFSPGQMFDQTLGYMRRNGGELADNLGQSVRQNPLPLLLTGIGIAWLITASGAARSSESGARAGSSKASFGDRLGEKFGGIKSAASDTASGVGRSISSRVSQAAQSAGAGARWAREGVGTSAQWAREGVDRMIDEQPLVLGALGLALGALLGATLPMTEAEGRFMGSTRGDAGPSAGGPMGSSRPPSDPSGRHH